MDGHTRRCGCRREIEGLVKVRLLVGVYEMTPMNSEALCAIDPLTMLMIPVTIATLW